MQNKHSHHSKKHHSGHLEDWSNKTSQTNSKKSAHENFQHVSLILLAQPNLKKESDYQITFETGFLEGKGISIGDDGKEINFNISGSYRLELSGYFFSSNPTDVLLSFMSDNFSREIDCFTQINILSDNKITFMSHSTLIPVKKNQKIKVKLSPLSNTDISLKNGTRLIIYRVA